MVVENSIAFVERIYNNPNIPEGFRKILAPFINSRKTAGIKLFMIISSLAGASFMSAGIFSIISHNWDDFPKHVRGVLSLFPALIALYFYYLAIFKHSKSTVWKEASGLFLFFMIGASIAMVSATYQMDGDFKKFAIVWLVLSLPILYITRSSSIMPFYLGLAGYFAFPHISWGFFGPAGFDENENLLFFWLFFLAALPHFIMTFNKPEKGQGIRTVFLSYIFAIYLTFNLAFIFPGGYIFWYIALIVGFYYVSRLYFNNNSLGQRPFDILAYLILGWSLLILSASPGYSDSTYVFLKLDPIYKMGEHEGQRALFHFIGLIVFLGTIIFSIVQFVKKTKMSKHIFALPLIVLVQLLLLIFERADIVDLMWIGDWLVYLYVIGFAIHCLSDGGKRNRFAKIIFGFLLITFFLWFRYFDSDMGFIMKGLVFMLAGAFFFLLNFIAKDDLDRIEDEA